jgi:outer membrane protein OmpA-like peptidoglycan-associated protein/peptidoglycan hydrolase-like protein with peptidoglycan-binding domain
MTEELTFEEEALEFAPEMEWSGEDETSSFVGSALARSAGASPCSFCVPLTHFAFDDANLQPAHKQIVWLTADAIARCVLPRAKGPVTVWITGHADKVGGDTYNMQLGERRAQNVDAAFRAALESIAPGSAARVKSVATSRGESEPLSDDDAFNRRVSICWEAACPVCESKPCKCPQQRDCPPCKGGEIVVPPQTPGVTFAIEAETFVAPLAPLTRGLPEFLQGLVRQIDREIGKPVEPARPDERSTLRTRCTLTAVVRNGKLEAVTASPVQPKVRQHCSSQLGACAKVAVQPPRVTPPRRVSPTAFEFSYEFRSQPPQLLEQLLRQAAPGRTLQFYHRVRAKVELVNGRATVSAKLEGSEFPSHRLYIDGHLKQTLRQHLELGSINLFPTREAESFEWEDEWEDESPENERAAVLAEIRDGNTDEVQLSNMVFFFRHPERNGRLISRSEPGFSSLSSEWLAIRDSLVRPLLQNPQPGGGQEPGSSPDPGYGTTDPRCAAEWPASRLAGVRNNAAAAAMAEVGRWQNGKLKETSPQVQTRLREYWQGAGLSSSQAASYAANRTAWSAAFISWVMRTAGAGSAFSYSPSHTTYISAAKANRESGSCNPFKLYRLNERRPVVGDIIVNSYPIKWGCKRSGTASYDNFETQGCSHCDVVVKVVPGQITKVGGNLSDSVGMRTARTDANGYIIPGQGDEPCWGIIKVGESSGGGSPGPQPPPPVTAPANVDRSSPDYIRWYQGALNRIQGAGLAVDGDAGPITKAAVQRFQVNHALTPDGIVGPQTEAALIAAGAGRPPAGSPAPGGGTPTGGTPDIVSVRGIQVARSIAAQVESMLAAAAADGIQLTGSGYRSSASQIALRKQNCGTSEYDIWKKPSSQCTPPTAPPGQSMHEVGLAIDFTLNGGTKDRAANLADPRFRWLQANASRFGLRNLASEAWHWSTNGH